MRLEGYRCSECAKPVGLMANQQGAPERFRCPKTGRLAQLQTPIHRDTKPLSAAGREDPVQQLISKARSGDGRN